MKICKNCGSTLNDDEDFCVICEEYYDKKISNTSELEYTEKTKVDKKEEGISPKLKRLIIIGAIVLVVVIIVSIVRESNKGTPEVLIEEYMTALSEGNAKELVECVAVSGAEKNDLYASAWASFWIQEELFSSGESTYVIQGIESMSFKENKQFWLSDISDNAYATDREVGTMAKATVVQTIKEGSFSNTVYYDVYMGVYKGKWKVIVGRVREN
jgi:hypothetical protein